MEKYINTLRSEMEKLMFPLPTAKSDLCKICAENMGTMFCLECNHVFCVACNLSYHASAELRVHTLISGYIHCLF